MRRAGEPEEQRDSGSFPPVRVFLALMTVLLVVAGVVLFTRDDPPPEPTPTQSPSPDFSLTDAEAIARFKELHALSLKAGRTRDASLLNSVFTASGPALRRANQSIRQLIRDSVFDRTTNRIISVTVVENTADEIVLKERGLLRPCFVTEGGRDVTKDASLVREVTEWTLVEQRSVWLIHDASFLSSKALKKKVRRCG